MDKKKICIKDVAKAKIDCLKSWAKRYEDELYCAGCVVGTGVACATIGFIVGRINGYFSGLNDGTVIGTEIGKADAAASIAEKILLAVIDEESNENVK